MIPFGCLMQINPSSMAVHAANTLDLDFSKGLNFAKEVRCHFQMVVHPFIGSAHFTMTVSFGRASFHLDDDSVGLALEAAIGGYCGEINVSR
jgi:hypothetical protein